MVKLKVSVPEMSVMCTKLLVGSQNNLAQHWPKLGLPEDKFGHVQLLYSAETLDE